MRRFVLAAWLGICALGLGTNSRLNAQNRIYLDDAPLLEGGASQEILVLVDNEEPVHAFSFALRFDPAELSVVAVTNTSTASENADFFDGTINAGGTLSHGCVFDYIGGDRPPGTDPLPAGTGHAIAKLIVDVEARPVAGTTTLQFDTIDRATNVLTGASGFSLEIATEDGVVPIESRQPVILDISDNEGLPGDTFTVEGRNFDGPGFSVNVCDVEAEFSVGGPDDSVLTVTAPPCAESGEVTVEICNEFGCASTTFTYESRIPSIQPIPPVCFRPGDTITLAGDYFDEPGLVVRICDIEVDADVAPDGRSLSVTAPPCQEGLVSLEICNIHGCLSQPQGLCYVGDNSVILLRGDCNNDGTVGGVVTDAIFALNFNFVGGVPPACAAACDADGDGTYSGVVTDAVYLLNFSFLGGPPPPPPFPDCGPGTATDNVIGCDAPCVES